MKGKEIKFMVILHCFHDQCPFFTTAVSRNSQKHNMLWATGARWQRRQAAEGRAHVHKGKQKRAWKTSLVFISHCSSVHLHAATPSLFSPPLLCVQIGEFCQIYRLFSLVVFTHSPTFREWLYWSVPTGSVLVRPGPRGRPSPIGNKRDLEGKTWEKTER